MFFELILKCLKNDLLILNHYQKIGYTHHLIVSKQLTTICILLCKITDFLVLDAMQFYISGAKVAIIAPAIRVKMQRCQFNNSIVLSVLTLGPSLKVQNLDFILIREIILRFLYLKH